MPEWSDDNVQMAYEAALSGDRPLEIAALLGVNYHEYNALKREHPELRDAINKGRREYRARLTRLAFDDHLKKGENWSPSSTKGLSENQLRFLSVYPMCGNITRASDVIGLTPFAHWEWLQNEDYRRAFEQAQREATDYLTTEAHRRAVEGVRKMKFHNGRPIMIPCAATDPEAIRVQRDDGSVFYHKPYLEYEKSDTLLIFLLKAADPEKFNDRLRIQGTTEHQHIHQHAHQVIEVDSLNLPLEVRERILDAAREGKVIDVESSGDGSNGNHRSAGFLSGPGSGRQSA